ncbi:helix-turn-helix domain-containing protein [Agromyces sp. CFH 90414]|uniref:Helix-turn-helix domain-containing protein n=1 Tax=Agromyces agglutinans TaxID=2662258 RepID=A0A6I2F5E5_9MICO|nr:IclR family transcriptional regulator [Agromyces agglutinans]MRG60665.1 helix-turn-helix domain-containing protein [Agromyces agglutinans]
MRTADWTDSVSVLDRVTAVFEAFGEHDEGLGVSELARRANLPKSTVSRIAADLVTQRFLDRDGGKLYLGVRLFELAQGVEHPRRLRRVALPVMADLRDATGHTVSLAILEGAEVVCIAFVRGAEASTPPARIGGRLPAVSTALGTAILAFSPPEVVDRVVERALERRTSAHRVDAPALRRELAEVRRLGVAAEAGEGVPGRASAASPVLGHSGAPIAAIGVSGSDSDGFRDRVAPALRTAALTLGRRMTAEGLH